MQGLLESLPLVLLIAFILFFIYIIILGKPIIKTNEFQTYGKQKNQRGDRTRS